MSQGDLIMLPFDAEQVEKNVKAATTPDLLDRVTFYREGMEAEAIDIIETELRRRGVSAAELEAHESKTRSDKLVDSNGVAQRCSFCSSPAVSESWGWHWLWGKVPLFPRPFRNCRAHEPTRKEKN
jgi:hypothetical protein